MEIDADRKPPQNYATLARWPVAIVLGLISIAGGLLTLREPLWIDELHTYWTCSDSLSSVASRAQFGNQSPLWFWIDAIWLQSLSSFTSSRAIQQIVLRLPSLLCWFATFFIIGLWIARYARSQSSRAVQLSTACSLGALLWCDQLSWFYAIEARPYAAVCLLCTISALSQQQMFWGSNRLQRVIYIASSVAAIYMHYTSIIVVGCVWLGSFLSNHNASKRESIIDCSIVVFLAIPAFSHLLQIGQSRHLWNSFAGNFDWQSVRSLLPIDWLLIAALAWIVQCVRGKNNFDQRTRFALAIGVAICLSVIAVWAMGALSIAPLIHSRYVLGAYPLVLLATGILLVQLNSRSLMFLATGMMAIAWMITQGGPFVVRYGAPIVWQRQEDWPSAIEAIERVTAEADGVQKAFAPMLVETANQDSIDRYGRDQLAYGWFAAKSLYGSRLENVDSVGTPLILSNAVDRWDEELSLAESNSKDTLILARTYAPSLQHWLEKHLETIHDPKIKLECLFGNGSQRLCVFRIRKNP